MLVLSRRVGEEIVIADQVRVRVVSLRGKRVRLAIAAPEYIPIQRAEIYSNRIGVERSGSRAAEAVPEPV